MHCKLKFQKRTNKSHGNQHTTALYHTPSPGSLLDANSGPHQTAQQHVLTSPGPSCCTADSDDPNDRHHTSLYGCF